MERGALRCTCPFDNLGADVGGASRSASVTPISRQQRVASASVACLVVLWPMPLVFRSVQQHPGNPEPDLILSHHTARATARRLPPSIEHLLPLPVDPSQMAMTRFLRSTGITPLHHYKETDSPPQLDSDDAAMT
jgi:hypothetical protein